MKLVQEKAGGIALAVAVTVPAYCSSALRLTSNETLETQGMSVLLFHNAYHHMLGEPRSVQRLSQPR